MTTSALVSVINHYHIKGLHLFWDTLFFQAQKALKRNNNNNNNNNNTTKNKDKNDDDDDDNFYFRSSSFL